MYDSALLDLSFLFKAIPTFSTAEATPATAVNPNQAQLVALLAQLNRRRYVLVATTTFAYSYREICTSTYEYITDKLMDMNKNV